MRETVYCRSEMASEKFLGMKDIKVVSLACSRCETVKELMRVLRGVVYRLKRMGPRADPWRTPQVRGVREEFKKQMCETTSLR